VVTRRQGSVSAFDAHVGLGEVLADDGARFPFHCVEIDDGSRSIEVGAPVSFDVVSKLGRWEAMRLSRRSTP